MGFYTHHAIVITASGYDELELLQLYEFCKSSPLPVTDIVRNQFGGYTFLVCPDGSKEGWGVSDEGDRWRKAICDYIDLRAYDDGSNQFSYVEVEFGNEYNPTIAHALRTNSGMQGERCV